MPSQIQASYQNRLIDYICQNRVKKTSLMILLIKFKVFDENKELYEKNLILSLIKNKIKSFMP